MKNVAVNDLKYAGIVTLSQRIGKTKTVIKEVHNAGGASLFSFLANCIIGDFELAKKTRPTKIMLLHENDDPDDPYTPVSGFIYMLSPPEKVSIEDGAAVQYSFMVQRELLKSDFTHIGLYSDSITSCNSYSSYSAICQVGSGSDKVSVSQLSASSALIVDWKLIISNQTGTGSAQASTESAAPSAE